jgi:hypothetical protein
MSQHFIITFVAPAGCACWTPCSPPLTTDQSKGASALPSLTTENRCSSHHATPAFEKQCDFVVGRAARVLHTRVLRSRWGQRVIIPAFTSVKRNAVPTGDLPQRQEFLNCVWLSMCHDISTYFQLQGRLKDNCKPPDPRGAAASPACSCFRQEEHLSFGKVKPDGECRLSGIMTSLRLRNVFVVSPAISWLQAGLRPALPSNKSSGGGSCC